MKTKMTEPTKNHPSPSAAPPKRRTFEAELAALNALRDLSPAAAAPEIAQALTLRHNLLVSKAATLALRVCTPASITWPYWSLLRAVLPGPLSFCIVRWIGSYG
jgi:hypothetical protein